MVATPKSRALGLAMRKARTDSRTTLRALAGRIGRHSGEISRWETGERPISPERAAQILSALGTTGEHYREIVSLAYEAKNPPRVGTTLPERAQQLDALTEFERTASRITAVAPLLVPGLLQEERYIRAIMSGGGHIAADDAEARVELRLSRQQVLTRDDPVQLNAFIGEAVLHQVLGDRTVLVTQLRHLLRWWQHPNITIRVIPFGVGWHPALEGSFILVESEKASPVIELENRRSTLLLHEEADVQVYRRAIRDLEAVALDAVASAREVATVVRRMNGG